MSLIVNIEKRLGHFTLRIAFESGKQTVGILGGSGCGKSLTLQCIAGIITPDKGEIVLNGRTLFHANKRINLPPQKRNIGYLFQQYALFPQMTVAQNLATGMPDPTNRTALHSMLQTMQLTAQANLYPTQLSGGQKQRTALGRLLLSQPEVLLLDEPFAALDSHLTWQLEQELLTVLDSYKGETIFVSHSRNEIYHICKRVVVLEHGAVSGTGTVEQIFEQPQTYAAAVLSGCKNISPVCTTKDGIFCTAWGVEFPLPNLQNYAYVGVRAHHWRKANANDLFAVPANIIRIIPDPFSYILLLQNTTTKTTGVTPIRWEIPKTVPLPFTVGDIVNITVEPTQILGLQ